MRNQGFNRVQVRPPSTRVSAIGCSPEIGWTYPNGLSERVVRKTGQFAISWGKAVRVDKQKLVASAADTDELLQNESQKHEDSDKNRSRLGNPGHGCNCPGR